MGRPEMPLRMINRPATWPYRNDIHFEIMKSLRQPFRSFIGNFYFAKSRIFCRMTNYSTAKKGGIRRSVGNRRERAHREITKRNRRQKSEREKEITARKQIFHVLTISTYCTHRLGVRRPGCSLSNSFHRHRFWNLSIPVEALYIAN